MEQAYQVLERELTEWCGHPTVVCSSGTAALHLALESLRLPLGSRVLVPDFTMIACARAVTLAGLEPVFIDCNDDLLIDPDLIDKACSEQPPNWTGASRGRIAAVMPVHIYGRRCDMDSIALLASKYDLLVVEDLAEAHGISPHENTDAACWSFYANKIIAGEEGGAICFPHVRSYSLAKSLRCLGFTEAHDFTHVPRGHNYRLANCLSEQILVSLRNRGTLLEWRRAIEAQYDLYCPEGMRMPERQAPWVYDLRIPGMPKSVQDRMVEALRAAGIGARHGFKPMHSQEEYRKCKVVKADAWSRASLLSSEVIYLPIEPGKTTVDSIRLAFEIVRRVVVEMKPAPQE